jgi:prefoldin subunit 5
MSNLRPESRIKSLEKRATDIEAGIEELASDTAESSKALFQHVQLGFQQAHDFVQERFAEINTRLDNMATKDDISKLETDISELKGLIKQLLQQRPGGE